MCSSDLPLEEWGERESITLFWHWLTECLGDRRKHVDVLGEVIDSRSVARRKSWVTDDSQNVVALFEETELLLEPMIAELFGVIGGDDDDRVVPHPSFDE